MNLVVKTGRALYRLPVQREMSKNQFARFREINKGGQALVFPLDRRFGPTVIPLDELEFVAMSGNDKDQMANYVQGKEGDPKSVH